MALSRAYNLRLFVGIPGSYTGYPGSYTGYINLAPLGLFGSYLSYERFLKKFVPFLSIT